MNGQSLRQAFRSGIPGGLIGGVSIWIYEAVVWVHYQHLLPLSGIPANAVALVFGKTLQMHLGGLASVLGSAIHFGFAMGWGIVFAACWRWFRRRDCEATLVALLMAPLLWTVMHAAIAIAGSDHPDYRDPAVISGGILSHIFYTVPMALVVRQSAAGHSILSVSPTKDR